MLEERLGQRKALLDSPGLPLFLLRQHDRRLVLWCERHPEVLAVEAWGAFQAEVQAPWLMELRLELATRLGFGDDPARPGGCSRSSPANDLVTRWQLAAHFSDAVLPAEIPREPELQIWVAMALARRGQEARLPPVWLAWVRAQEGGGPETGAQLRNLLAGLWSCNRAGWRHWFYPLMLGLPEALHPAMINWLAGHTDNSSLVEAMGVSGAGRFRPWLDDLAAQDGALGAVAKDALQGSDPDSGNLQARLRHWWSRWRRLEGAPWSLFGGCWQ